MCICEIWVYRDCGCSYDRYVPCYELDQQKKFNTIESAQSSSMILSTSSTTYPVNQPFHTHPQEAGSVGIITSTDGFCSNFSQPNINTCNHLATTTIHKEFFESICDDCLLEELDEDVSIHSASSYSSSGLQITSDNPILESTVTIEIERSSTDDRSELEKSEMTSTVVDTLQSQYKIEVEYKNFKFPASRRDSSPSIAHIRTSHHRPIRASVDNSTTNNDADDEGSLNLRPSLNSTLTSPLNSPSRGRARSRTRNIRREGIDISRDDLPIVSGRNSKDKRSMDRFRSAFRDKASDKERGESMFKRWTAKDIGSWSKAKNVKKKVRELGSNLGRSQSMKKEPTNIFEPNEADNEDLRKLASRQQNLLDSYHASYGMPGPALEMGKDENENHMLQSEQAAPSNMANNGIKAKFDNVNELINQSTMMTDSGPTTWDEHLQQDLSSVRNERRGVRLAKSASNLFERPFKPKLKITNQIRTSPPHPASIEAEPALLHSEGSDGSLGTAAEFRIRQSEEHAILRSPRSSSVSLPPISLSLGTTAAWPLLVEDGERLGEIMGPNDFDEYSEDDDNYPQWRRIGSLSSNLSTRPITKSTSLYNLRHQTLELPDTIRSTGSMESLVNAIHNLQLQGIDSDLRMQTNQNRVDSSMSVTNIQGEDQDRNMIDIFPSPPQRGSHSLDKRISSISWPRSTSIAMTDFVPTTTEEDAMNIGDGRLSIHPLTTEFIQGLTFNKKKKKSEMDGKNWEVQELYTRSNPWVE